MLEAPRCDHAAARGAFDEALLEQVRLVYVLDRVLLLVDRGGEGREADRAAGELGRDRGEDRAVVTIEAGAVDLQEAQGIPGDLARDESRAADLREVPHPLQEAVGDARGPPRAFGDLALAVALDPDTENLGGAAHNPRQVLGFVMLEPVADAEAVAKRGREQPRPGRRSDEREGRQLERDGAGAGSLAEHDRQPALLHRGIQGLLDRATEAVDLVDEEDGSRLERGQERRDVRLSLQ